MCNKLKITDQGKLIAFTLVSLFTTALHAGNESGGGGFAFSGSKAYLRSAIKKSQSALDHNDANCIAAEMAKVGAGPIDLGKAANIIGNTRINYFAERARKNEEGILEPLVMDYGKDEKGEYIEALRLFFVGFMTYSEMNVTDVARKLLFHEVSHHFGYDEKQAKNFAELMTVASVEKPMGKCWKY